MPAYPTTQPSHSCSCDCLVGLPVLVVGGPVRGPGLLPPPHLQEGHHQGRRARTAGQVAPPPSPLLWTQPSFPIASQPSSFPRPFACPCLRHFRLTRPLSALSALSSPHLVLPPPPPQDELQDIRRTLRKPSLAFRTLRTGVNSYLEYIIELKRSEAASIPSDWLLVSQTKDFVRYHTPKVGTRGPWWSQASNSRPGQLLVLRE